MIKTRGKNLVVEWKHKRTTDGKCLEIKLATHDQGCHLLKKNITWKYSKSHQPFFVYLEGNGTPENRSGKSRARES